MVARVGCQPTRATPRKADFLREVLGKQSQKVGRTDEGKEWMLGFNLGLIGRRSK